MDQLLEPSERHDKSLNLADDFSKNHVSNSILNPPNLNPKFPSLPKMRGFKIAFLNICSLTCHYDELCVFMEDRAIDILGLNETRLDNTFADSQFDIEGYDIIRRDRNRHGGGVAFYVAQSLTYVNRQDLLSHEDLEILTVEIKKPKSKPFLVTTWYRPPDSKVEIFDKFESYLLKLDQEDKESIIMGDTNCNLLSQSFDHKAEHLKFITETYQYIQLIDQPTRITSSTRTLIDHIFTNKPNIITNHVILHVGISDHSLIYATHKHNTLKADPKIIESRQFKNFDSDAFIEDIKETPFHFASLMDDPNEMWDVWKSLLLEVINKHAPMRKRKVKSKSSPWITAELRRKMRKRDFLKNQAVKQNSYQAWNDYKKARNEVNASIREARVTYFNDSIKKHRGNLKETWNIINSSLGRKPKMTVINELIDAGKVFVQKKDIAEQMNNHFCSLGSKLASFIPDTASQPEDFLGRTDLNFCFRPVNVEYILNLISNLKPSVSCGLDNISSRLLKLVVRISQTLYVILLIMCWRLEYFLMIGKRQKYILFLSLMKEILQVTIDRFLFYLLFRKL